MEICDSSSANDTVQALAGDVSIVLVITRKVQLFLVTLLQLCLVSNPLEPSLRTLVLKAKEFAGIEERRHCRI